MSFTILIDSLTLNNFSPQDITIYLEESIPSHLTKVGLKYLFLYHQTDLMRVFLDPKAPQLISFKNIYVHCDIISKDTNYLNGQKSDLLFVAPYNASPARKCAVYNIENCLYKKLKSSDITSIRIYLTDNNNNLLDSTSFGGQLALVYELDFV